MVHAAHATWSSVQVQALSEAVQREVQARRRAEARAEHARHQVLAERTQGLELQRLAQENEVLVTRLAQMELDLK